MTARQIPPEMCRQLFTHIKSDERDRIEDLVAAYPSILQEATRGDGKKAIAYAVQGISYMSISCGAPFQADRAQGSIVEPSQRPFLHHSAAPVPGSTGCAFVSFLLLL